jgi:hypothetical protein
VAGYQPFAGEDDKARLSNALCCRVVFVLTCGGQKTKPCCMRTICPFCWAREVRRHWLMIDRAFFPRLPSATQRVRVVDTGGEMKKSSSFTRSVKGGETAVNSPYDLVRRVFTFRIPTSVEMEQAGWHTEMGQPAHMAFYVSGIKAWIESRIRGQLDPKLYRLPECRASLKAAGPGGGVLESLHFRRITEDGKVWPWEVQIQHLILAVDGSKISDALPVAATMPKYHKVYPRPRRRLVVREVAKTLHHPN